jgi:hypothetical protein
MENFIYTTDEPLEVGKRYWLMDITPVVRTPTPRNFLRAMSQIKHLPHGTAVRIKGIKHKRGKRWYHTRQGFINELALIGKRIRPIP